MLVIYQREPHARQLAFDSIAQPTTFTERVALARKMIAEDQLDVDVWIDDLGDTSRAAFGDLPNSVIVIDKTSTVRLKHSWFDPTGLARALKELAPARSRARAVSNRGYVLAAKWHALLAPPIRNFIANALEQDLVQVVARAWILHSVCRGGSLEVAAILNEHELAARELSDLPKHHGASGT